MSIDVSSVKYSDSDSEELIHILIHVFYGDFFVPFNYYETWVNSADDKLTILFLLFPRKWALKFKANCLLSQSFFLGKIKKTRGPRATVRSPE